MFLASLQSRKDALRGWNIILLFCYFTLSRDRRFRKRKKKEEEEEEEEEEEDEEEDQEEAEHRRTIKKNWIRFFFLYAPGENAAQI